MERLQGLTGILLLTGIAFALSSNRSRINPRIVIAGILLQVFLAWLFLSFPPAVAVFGWFATVVTRIISFADDGTRFLFGNVSDASGPWGFIFAVKVLPIIIFFAAFMAVLYHLGIMQRVVAAVAWVLRRTLGVTGAEALSASANIFVGQTEAPLCIRPYINAMTRSQIMAIMTGGFATIAGSVMAAYITKLGGDSEAGRILFAKHLMTASVMSAPAAFVMAKIMVPEIEQPRPETLTSLMKDERTTRNVLDAAAAGATDGLKLALNVAAMLVAFVALLAMLNWPLQALSMLEPIARWREAHGIPVLSFESILGYIFMPITWCQGVPAADCAAVGALLGKQVIATEFVAYLSLSDHISAGTISSRAAQIATYSLCGFANLPSIAIQIGGLSALAPERRADFASLGLRAMTAGALACWMTGTIAGIFIQP
ncbi:MAG: NupC/NupG family nucleoside CNT transporter [Phycisphaerae bacterium]|nr:NupC/NupG family nucleoside CNT transporter [Phycisphaerae bacterium]